MKELLVRFIREEDGDVVQNVIIIAIMAALALLFGRTIKEFVDGLMANIKGTGGDVASFADGMNPGAEG